MCPLAVQLTRALLLVVLALAWATSGSAQCGSANSAVSLLPSIPAQKKPPAEPILPEAGFLSNTHYTSQFFGFSFDLPLTVEGHQVMMPLMPEKRHALLALQFEQGRERGYILVTAEDPAPGYDVNIPEERQKELQEQVFKSGTEYGRLQQEYERLEGSEDAALQAQTAEDALAKARPAIAQYLRLRIAAEVLQRAMDSYREKHQGPVLSRASELFSRLTLGEHDGLTTAFGNDDRPVMVAIRKNKEQVEVAGLSDGTRDQLYLALRLAAIEDHVARVAPCPVILDDILIHSDDLRASAALQVLAEIAQRTQVLFFTHHSRLADLGSKAGASVIHLQASALSAVV